MPAAETGVSKSALMPEPAFCISVIDARLEFSADLRSPEVM